MLEAIRTYQDNIADEFLGGIIAESRKRGIYDDFGEERMQLVLEGIWNKVKNDLKYSQKMEGQLEDFLIQK